MPSPNVKPKERLGLGLGTVQFGFDYGVTNSHGKPSDNSVLDILSDALSHGVGIIDTAPGYGSAEERLGVLLPQNHGSRIVTKTIARPQLTRFSAEDAKIVRDGFFASLNKLQQESVYGLLVHLGTDLLLPGADRLVETLMALRDGGHVKKVGVSIYDADELDGILEKFEPEIVQLPLSIADQRLLKSGHLAGLKSRGIEIHLRSVFLQGVLLAEPATLPAFMQAYVPQLEKIRAACPTASPLEICLAFVRQISEVDCVVAGAAAFEEWRSIRRTFECSRELSFDFNSLAICDPQFLNPSNWPTAAS